MDTSSLLELSRSLLEVEGDDYVTVAAGSLKRRVGGDDVLWMQTCWVGGSFAAWRLSTRSRDSACERVLPGMYQHPAIQSYLQAPSDLAPRRLSDVPKGGDDRHVAALELSRTFVGSHQLSLVVDVRPPYTGKGWILARDGRDFDDRCVEAAAELLPLLLVFDRLHGPDITSVPTGRAAEVDTWADLTPREHQVAELLACGMTARAIGHVLGISPRTVSKHLENAYRKLGQHDRLLVAVDHRA